MHHPDRNRGMDRESTARPLSETREQTVQQLCLHFAKDHLEVAEFERRLDAAHRAADGGELARLLADLPALPVPAAAAPAGRAPATAAQGRPETADPAQVRSRQIVLAVMAGADRKGRWTPARRVFGLAIMGGTALDFRDAVLGPGVTEIYVVACMGGVEIIVPPWLAVETSGFALMGGFDQTDHLPAGQDPDAPRLRINGVALMGGIEVAVRLPGESSREARRREKLERRSPRRLGSRDGE
jgi:hypothetical protein